jgi:pyruvate/2-oxoglutarate dehydrogenase complex dihydrolipoamide acyltransferase (E2) component
MKSLFLLLICACSLFLCRFLPAAHAELYKYTDAHGVVNMTNNVKAVPTKYRSTMQVVHEEKKEQPAQQAQQSEEAATEAAAPAPAPAPASTFATLSERYVWFKPLLFVAAALVGFLCLIKATSLIPSRLVGRLVLVAFAAGVFAFLYKEYSESLLEKTRKLKGETAAIASKSAARQQSLATGELPLEEQKK